MGSLSSLILAGGFATRLRPLSCSRPKILFPIVNKPLIEWIFERLARNEVDRAILAVSYRTEVMLREFKLRKHGLEVLYSRDPLRKPLGTGGAIKKAEKIIGRDQPFLVLNEDIFADLEYTDILKAHRNKNAVATIALSHVKDPSRYGVAELDEKNFITRFIEKPPKGTAPTNLINAGVYVLEPEIFEYLPSNTKVSIERDVFTKLAKEGRLFGYPFKGAWMDIGKPEDYMQINRRILEASSSSRQPAAQSQSLLRNPVAIDENVTIGKESTIGPYVVLGHDVSIGRNTKIRNSIVFSHAVISDCVTVEGSIIGEGVTVGGNARISKGCIVGDHARICDGVHLEEGISVCPAIEVTKNLTVSKRIC